MHWLRPALLGRWQAVSPPEMSPEQAELRSPGLQYSMLMKKMERQWLKVKRVQLGLRAAFVLEQMACSCILHSKSTRGEEGKRRVRFFWT